ncbi:hypothetical protein [Paenibacillus lutimineralis]|uniref:hypothetical protein n=1 Tax=Paenibacillus lutimineralis TaxID=2707005 RepID=UPI001D04F9D6|nr:hypothetical protein [Paenibacillus lutimineralis]
MRKYTLIGDTELIRYIVELEQGIQSAGQPLVANTILLLLAEMIFCGISVFDQFI